MVKERGIEPIQRAARTEDRVAGWRAAVYNAGADIRAVRLLES